MKETEKKDFEEKEQSTSEEKEEMKQENKESEEPIEEEIANEIGIAETENEVSEDVSENIKESDDKESSMKEIQSEEQDEPKVSTEEIEIKAENASDAGDSEKISEEESEVISDEQSTEETSEDGEDAVIKSVTENTEEALETEAEKVSEDEPENLKDETESDTEKVQALPEEPSVQPIEDDTKQETKALEKEAKKGIFAEFKEAPYVTKKAFAVFLAGAIVISTLLGAGLASLIHYLNDPEHYFEEDESYMIEEELPSFRDDNVRPREDFNDEDLDEDGIEFRGGDAFEYPLYNEDAADSEGPLIGIYIEDIQTENGNLVKVADINGENAKKAGLKAGDIIIGYNGERIFSSYDLTSRVKSSQRGDKVTLDVVRDGQTLKITTTLE